jgi:hypothetical protein
VGAPCPNGVHCFDRDSKTISVIFKNNARVFVTTVQTLDAANRGGLNFINEIMPGRRWMIGFDELHHYGDGMSWGNAAKAVVEKAAFTMAMSATPYRRIAGLIFPKPELVITYQEAVDEGAVKEMVCVSYDYRVTVIEGDSDPINYTTTQLMALVPPEGIDVWEERGNIRYSPQYIHPLIVHPLERLRMKRAESGRPCQMLIRAMSCSHAKVVCQQVKANCGDLKVDWVGTGPRGQKDQENRMIIERFCPRKINGQRDTPSLDVLVQVNMAGEGFDSVYVAEVVDLFPVSKTAEEGNAPQTKQFAGRGARVFPTVSGSPVLCHFNIPTDHPLGDDEAYFLHDWMDSDGNGKVKKLLKKRPAPDLKDPPFLRDLPENREIELLNVTKEDRLFKEFVKLGIRKGEPQYEGNEEKWLSIYKLVVNGVAREQSAQTRSFQLREMITVAIGKIARWQARNAPDLNSATIGRYATELNRALILKFGKRREEMSNDELERVYMELKKLAPAEKGIAP